MAQTPKEGAEGEIDLDVTQRILDRLSISREVGTANVHVVTNRGAVTLSGVLPTRDQRQAAEEIARSVKGVASVRNEIRVPGEGGEGTVDVASPDGSVEP